DLAADVGGHLTAEVALHLVVALDVVAQCDQLVIREVLDPDVLVDAGLGQGLERPRATDTVDVRQCDLNALLARDVDACQTCHGVLLLIDRWRCWAPPVHRPPTGGVPLARSWRSSKY